MINHSDPLVQLKITSATCSFFALGTTIYRLYYRWGRLWADDFWALFAFVALMIQVIGVFLHIPMPNNLSRTTRVAAYYLMATAFYAVIWTSRLSILFSIVRIDPSAERRQRLFWVALAFVSASLFLLAQLFWVCEPNPSWKNAPNPQCTLPLQVAICQLITDVIADSILLFAPLPLFRNLFDKSLRHKLTLIFSTCIVTTIISLVHAAFILRRGHTKVLISAVVEDSLSLIVANIPVVVTTMIDVVGEAGQPRTSRLTQLSSMFWSSDDAQTSRRGILTGQVVPTRDLDTIGEESPDDMELSCAKTNDNVSRPWNRNDREQTPSSKDVATSLDRPTLLV
ncbi:hypothetical protein B0H19DRAFT_1112752 [Mycena capillaripes]|nr:hypothetical protein B0H19DRAFT_1112752 [Mycena capillaripes]